MDEQTKLILALYQVDNLTQLTKDNEYKHYLYCKLSSIKCELERQLTNLTNQSKIKEQTVEDDD
jgi:predicted site-specific integrase-resolvase